MTDITRIAAHLVVLETIQADLAAISTRQDPERRLEMVQLRRQLSDQTALIGTTAAALFVDLPEANAEFRRHYSAMRSAAALHQAEWPAVRLGEFDDQYARSASIVRERNRAFTGWLRKKIENLREGR